MGAKNRDKSKSPTKVSNRVAAQNRFQDMEDRSSNGSGTKVEPEPLISPYSGPFLGPEIRTVLLKDPNGGEGSEWVAVDQAGIIADMGQRMCENSCRMSMQMCENSNASLSSANSSPILMKQDLVSGNYYDVYHSSGNEIYRSRETLNANSNLTSEKDGDSYDSPVNMLDSDCESGISSVRQTVSNNSIKSILKKSSSSSLEKASGNSVVISSTTETRILPREEPEDKQLVKAKILNQTELKSYTPVQRPIISTIYPLPRSVSNYSNFSIASTDSPIGSSQHDTYNMRRVFGKPPISPKHSPEFVPLRRPARSVSSQPAILRESQSFPVDLINKAAEPHASKSGDRSSRSPRKDKPLKTSTTSDSIFSQTYSKVLSDTEMSAREAWAENQRKKAKMREEFFKLPYEEVNWEIVNGRRSRSEPRTKAYSVRPKTFGSYKDPKEPKSNPPKTHENHKYKRREESPEIVRNSSLNRSLPPNQRLNLPNNRTNNNGNNNNNDNDHNNNNDDDEIKIERGRKPYKFSPIKEMPEKVQRDFHSRSKLKNVLYDNEKVEPTSTNVYHMTEPPKHVLYDHENVKPILTERPKHVLYDQEKVKPSSVKGNYMTEPPKIVTKENYSQKTGVTERGSSIKPTKIQIKEGVQQTTMNREDFQQKTINREDFQQKITNNETFQQKTARSENFEQNSTNRKNFEQKIVNRDNHQKQMGVTERRSSDKPIKIIQQRTDATDRGGSVTPRKPKIQDREDFQQKRGVPNELQQKRGVPNEFQQKRGVPNESQQKRGVPNESQQKRGVPNEFQQQNRGVPNEFQQKQGVPSEFHQKRGVSERGTTVDIHMQRPPSNANHHLLLKTRLNPQGGSFTVTRHRVPNIPFKEQWEWINKYAPEALLPARNSSTPLAMPLPASTPSPTPSLAGSCCNSSSGSSSSGCYSGSCSPTPPPSRLLKGTPVPTPL